MNPELLFSPELDQDHEDAIAAATGIVENMFELAIDTAEHVIGMGSQSQPMAVQFTCAYVLASSVVYLAHTLDKALKEPRPAPTNNTP